MEAPRRLLLSPKARCHVSAGIRDQRRLLHAEREHALPRDAEARHHRRAAERIASRRDVRAGARTRRAAMRELLTAGGIVGMPGETVQQKTLVRL